MAINVEIRAGWFVHKPLPLEVIIGDEFAYGNDEDCVQTMVGELGRWKLIAYLPDNIGRGCEVIWHEGERNRVVLRQNLPCSKEELKAFYRMNERICQYWRGKLHVDGKRMSLKAFMATKTETERINEQAIRDLGKKLLDGYENRIEIGGAMWPLRPGREEGRLFLLSSDEFGDWLNEKQKIDACYWPVVYAEKKDGHGVVALTQFGPWEVPAIYLNQVPPKTFTIRSPQTGRSVQVEEWHIRVMDDSGLFCVMPYAEFRAKLPENKISRYDSDKILIQPMTSEELRAIYFPVEHQ